MPSLFPLSGESISGAGDAAAAALDAAAAGPRLALYEDLPLRTTRDLGDYAVSAPLAHLIGDLTAARFPLTRIGPTRYHAADHPAEITAAFIADQETASFAVAVEDDGTGRVCTFVDFPAAIPADAPVSACGYGARDPLTGALYENPGDVMAYVAALAGRTEAVQGAREECAAAGIRLAGWIGAVTSIRLAIDAVTQSAGVIWCPGMSRRYPAPVAGYVLALDKQAASLRADPSASIDDTADILRIAYDVSSATGKPQRHLELTASPQRYGGVVKELELPMLRTAANAVTVGGPILQRLACERYNVPLTVERHPEIRPGQWLTPDLPEWPFGDAYPTVMVLAVEIDHASRTAIVDAEWMRTTPEVRVTAHTLALSDTTDASVEIESRDGIVTMTIRDPDGRAVYGARVSLDGGPAQTTDDQGRVSFPYVSTGVPTEHELAVEAPGLEDQTLFVLL